MIYKMMLKPIAVAILICYLLQISEALTMAQLKKTGNMMKNTCMPKNNVQNDQVKDISKGDFVDDKNVKCYIACVLQMAQMMKNGKVNYDAAVKQIDLLFPDDMKTPMKESLTNCKKITDKYKDACESSYHVAKCMYEFDSEHFFFP